MDRYPLWLLLLVGWSEPLQESRGYKDENWIFRLVGVEVADLLQVLPMGMTRNVGFANGSKGMRQSFGGCALGAVGGTLAKGIGHDILSGRTGGSLDAQVHPETPVLLTTSSLD